MDDYKILKPVLTRMYMDWTGLDCKLTRVLYVASVFGKEAEGVLDLQKGGGL